MKKSGWKFYLTIIGSLVVMMVCTAYLKEKKGNSVATFVITETGKYTSLDPLDGDSSQNLPVARMLYATPVEIFSENTLGSYILESFDYNTEKKSIEWLVRNDLTYSDGSVITTEDVAFSVTRMAFSRPGFPVIRLIKGLKEWLRSPSPLKSYPEGIKISGNKITIQLIEDYPHPQFRFCLELFSIIPKRCVNLENNKINCDVIPTSGYYELKENIDRDLTFEKRFSVEMIQGKKYPKVIKILYRDAEEAFYAKELDSDRTVILSSESKVTREQQKKVESELKVAYTPAAWFTILQINPFVAPFTDSLCRLEFSEVFRKNYEKVSGDTSESSVFTKIVAGYQNPRELLESVSSQHTESTKTSCRQKMSGAKIKWGFDKTTPRTFVDSLTLTLKDLEIETDGPTQFKDRKEEVENFNAGNSAFMYGRTGFWALDPTGDIQMLFTPNLHKGLQNFWNDDKLQTLLGKVVENGKVNMKAVDAINSHLFSDGKFNVYSHIRRFYAFKNQNLISKLPIGITSPSPWQLFEEP